jgi:thiol-disulfide isomerase/thioredoxin
VDPLLLRALALVALVAAACALGLARRRTDGRSRAVAGGAAVTASDLGADLGPRATLLQISAPVCAPCRAARRVLSSVAADTPGVVHVEVDAEERLDLVRRLDVLRTPTLVVLDAAGRVVARSSGVPTPPQVHQALALAGVPAT